MHFAKLIHICFLAFLPLQMLAQIIHVHDEETKDPIEFAELYSNRPQAYATTNANGEAEISAFRDADSIEIRNLGYLTLLTSYAKLEAMGFRVQLEPSSFGIDEVVVSATKWRQSSGNVPMKITTITADEIRLQNPQTAADLLGITGKVYIQKSQQGGGSPMIRGFATNRLLYSVDGVRMNTAIFRGGNIQNVINLDPFATESTEILFGPGSVIYGSDAVGGVMSFRTLTPQFSSGERPLVTGKAIVRYASANDERTGHFDINVGWRRWAFVTSISSWDYDHLRQGMHGPDDYLKPFYVAREDSTDIVLTQEDPLLQRPSAYDQYNVMQKVRFSPNENWDFHYGFHFSETSPYGRYDRHNRMRDGQPRYGEWNYGPQRWMMHNLSVTNESPNAVYDVFTVRLAQQNFRESRINRDFQGSERRNQEEEVFAYSANLDFLKQFGRHSFSYGAEVVINDVNSAGSLTDIRTGSTSNGPSRYPNSTWTSIGVYVNDEFRITDDITGQAGLRYNRFIIDSEFDQTFFPFPFDEANIEDGALTGSIGAVIRPSASLVIKTNFATAFRAPNVDDVGKVFDSEPGAVTIPNPDLEAEYAYSFDIGFAKTIGDIAKLDITGYYTILNNAMVRRNTQLNGRDSILFEGELSQVQSIQNAARADVYGIQGSLEIKLPAGFRLQSDINWQRGEEELDEGDISPSRHAAPLFGVSRLMFSTKDVDLQFYATYQGERSFEDLAFEERRKDEIYAKDTNGNNFSPAWYTLNFKANYTINSTFSVGAGLENITDQRYRPYSSGISGPGRNFILSVAAEF